MNQAVDSGVLIVDDDLARLAFLITRIEYEPDLRVVAYATTAAEGLELAQTLEPDIVLSDFDVPDAEPLDLVAAWRQTVPSSAVVVYTAAWSEPVKRAARLNGADACLDKCVPPSQLIAALRGGLSGRRSPALAEG